MYQRYIGIDPGITGAIAWIDYDNGSFDSRNVEYIQTSVMTLKMGKKNDYDPAKMAEVISAIHDQKKSFVIIEQVHAMPGQGVTSMFNFGKGYGIWLALIAAFKIPYEIVTPQTWKKLMMPGMPKEKSASVMRVKQLYPAYHSLGNTQHNISDAILIARYGMEKYSK